MDTTRNIDAHFAKLEARLHRNICHIDKGSSAPAPDPNIGIAAATNAATGAEMAGVAREQLAWNRERWDEVKPVYNKILQQQIEAADTSQQRGTEQWNQYTNVFKPIEERVAKEAMDYGGEADQTAQAGRAIADVTGSFDAAAANQQRQLQASGVNPADPRYAALTQGAGLERAKAAAGAGTKAATDARLLGMSMRQNVAQFGRNMPATSIAQDAAALQASNAAQGNATGATMARNAGVNSALPWYSGSTDATTAGGNLNLGLYNSQSNNWRTQQQADASGMAGLGQLAGTLGAAWIAAKDGGIVKLKGRGYADGGMVDGGMSDGVPSGRMSDGPPARDGTPMKVIVIALPDPAIDPSDGTPLTAADMPDGLQRLAQAPIEAGTGKAVATRQQMEAGKFDKVDLKPTTQTMAQPAGQQALTREERAARTAAANRGPRDPKMRAQMGLPPIKYAEGGLIDVQAEQEPAPVEEPKPTMNPKKKKPAAAPVARYKSAFTADFENFGLRDGGLARKNYANGSVVDGPGTPTSDSIPAQLSDEEAVLNAEAVQLVGEDFVNRINQAGLERRQQGGGQTYEGQARRIA